MMKKMCGECQFYKELFYQGEKPAFCGRCVDTKSNSAGRVKSALKVACAAFKQKKGKTEDAKKEKE